MDVCALHLSSLHSPFDSFTSQPYLLDGCSTSMASHPPPPWAWCLPRKAEDQAQGRHIVERRTHPSQLPCPRTYRVDLLSLVFQDRLAPVHAYLSGRFLVGKVPIDSRRSIIVIGDTCVPDVYGILPFVCALDVSLPLSPIPSITCFPFPLSSPFPVSAWLSTVEPGLSLSCLLSDYPTFKRKLT